MMTSRRFCVHYALMAVTKSTRNIVVGVTGGIAAYKACQLIRLFKESGDSVRVVPTSNALKFVGAATFEALSGNPVDTGVFSRVDEVQHVRVGQEADLIVVAPATADFMARLVAGRADDLLTSTLLVATCPVVLAPAMHTEMWLHPATQANVETLRNRGITVLEPATGRLTGKDSGPGRLLDPEQIFALANAVGAGASFDLGLRGKKVLVSAGGTEEMIDPVRSLTNKSSGRQGFAFAEVASQAGAKVTVVAGRTAQLSTPAGAEIVSVGSACEMEAAMRQRAGEADFIVMAAAVADYRPANKAHKKLKKGESDGELAVIELVENPDILRALVEQRDESGRDTVILGFAAETHNELEYGRAKLRRKGVDALFVNSVAGGAVFGEAANRGWLVKASGEEIEIVEGSKLDVAAQIWRQLSVLN